MEATTKRINVKYINTTPVICNIEYESCPESPREWDNLGKMVLSHNRFNFENKAGINFDDFDGWDEVKEYLKKELDASVILPVQMYEHSGVRIYVGNSHDAWDGGQLGFIYATKEDILKEFDVKKITGEVIDRTVSILTSEVDIYSKYVDGEVYTWTLEDRNGNTIDGCSGYYDIEDIKEELKEYENIIYTFDGVEEDWI